MFRKINVFQIDVKLNLNKMNLNQKKNDFKFENENAKMSLISSNTFTNRRHINDNSRVKRETRAFFVATNK
jgi:hypothetical protein